MDLMNYDDVVKHLKKTNRVPNLLMGNGFSISYNPSIFSYNALSSFIDSTNDKDLKTLFHVIKTSNFEQIMKEIDLFIKLIEAFDNQSDIKERLKVLSNKLKTLLIEAVENSHPEHVFSIPQNKIDSCSDFLKYFTESKGKIFSTEQYVVPLKFAKSRI